MAIVGGSIAGLTTAILLGQLDIEVRVFERQAPGGEPRGAGVGIDLDLLAAVTGYIDTAPPYIRLRERRVVVEGRTQAERVEIPVTAHHLLRAFLHERIAPRKIVAPAEVVGLNLHEVEPLRLAFADGHQERFDVVVGADGARSVIRAGVVGEPLLPEYAGYVLWRGLLDEAALSPEARGWLFDVPALIVAPHARQQFVAYPVPGPAGEVEPGERRLAWGWYYGIHPDRLGHELELVGRRGEDIAPAECSPAILEDLQASANPHWPPAIQEVVERSLERGSLALHPVHELAVPRLARSGAVLIGDAAHVTSPITGSGVRAAMYDALVLIRALVDLQRIDAALGVYETRRISLARALVEQGRSAGWGFRLGY